LDQIERFAASNLADHDPVGAHAKRCAKEIADRHLAAPFRIRWPRFELTYVIALELELA
jgi:hypothetical protein